MADHDTDQEDRTLPPSEKRLRDAREEGRVARSRHLSTFLVLGGTLAGFATFGPDAFRGLQGLMASGLTLTAADARAAGELPVRLGSAAAGAFGLLAPLFLLLWAGSALAPLAQGGLVLTSKPFTPDFSRLSPLAGVKRIVSVDSVFELLKALAIATLVGGSALWALVDLREQAAGLAAMPVPAAIAASGRTITGALWGVVGILSLIALADVVHERRRHDKSLRMTFDEVKREARELEGDPHLKARVRQVQREMSRRRMMAAVPKADVVVTNPTHFAVALQYEEAGAAAPRIVALGKGEVALRIREIAEAAGVPRLEAPPLARALYRHGELDREIPAALFQAVARVLAYVYQLRRHERGEAPAPREPGEIAVPAGLDSGPEPEAGED